MKSLVKQSRWMAAGLLVMFAQGVAAGQPVINKFQQSFGFVTFECGFPVIVELEFNVIDRLYLDRNGIPVRISQTVRLEGVHTNPENGKFWVQNSAKTNHIDLQAETVTITGLEFIEHVPPPGIIAGRFVWKLPDGPFLTDLLSSAGRDDSDGFTLPPPTNCEALL